MIKVLDLLQHSPTACTFSICFGIGIMLSVAYVDPSESSTIVLRQALGGFFLLLPGLAQAAGGSRNVR
ncbi:MAG TPA: hypothetical protein VM120_18370 [Bryobacteraceae bacterium]|nr:hypothetical protein [Bryobacteraceae bacterium]